MEELELISTTTFPPKGITGGLWPLWKGECSAPPELGELLLRIPIDGKRCLKHHQLFIPRLKLSWERSAGSDFYPKQIQHRFSPAQGFPVPRLAGIQTGFHGQSRVQGEILLPELNCPGGTAGMAALGQPQQAHTAQCHAASS